MTTQLAVAAAADPGLRHPGHRRARDRLARERSSSSSASRLATPRAHRRGGPPRPPWPGTPATDRAPGCRRCARRSRPSWCATTGGRRGRPRRRRGGRPPAASARCTPPTARSWTAATRSWCPIPAGRTSARSARDLGAAARGYRLVAATELPARLRASRRAGDPAHQGDRRQLAGEPDGLPVDGRAAEDGGALGGRPAGCASSPTSATTSSGSTGRATAFGRRGPRRTASRSSRSPRPTR